jgi:uracil-DNA glycosylase family 4
MFIAEAPGADEVHPRVLSTLVGGSGRIHDRIARIAGTNSHHHRNTNCVKCRPEHNRKPTDTELRNCMRFLIQEVKEHNPNVIVALGDTALYALTGKTGIAKNRGVPLEGAGGRKVIATYHPAGIMRDQGKFALPVWDYQRAIEESKFPEIRRVEVRYISDARPTLDRGALLEKCLRTGVSVEDIETTGAFGTMQGALDFRSGQIVCIGVGHAIPGEADCYRWDDRVAEVISDIHLDPRIEKVGQNCEQFDWDFLWHKKVPEPVGVSIDTMNMEHLVSPDTPKDLGTLGANYTDMPYWKDQAKNNLFWYCCQDVDGTGRARNELKKNIHELGMDWLYYKHVMPLQPCLRAMRRRGIKKDVEKAIAYRIVLGKKADSLEAALREGLGRPGFNVNASKDVQKLLYEEMGLPVQYKRDKNGMRPTADAGAIEKLVELFPQHKILAAVSQIRTIRTKWIATYLDVETDEFDFVHPSIGSAKAANGRLNSWNPNGQNIPEELRVVYRADDDDHVWIEADWGQIEYRLAMVLSGDEAGLKMMTSGHDIFYATAADVLKKPIGQVTKQDRHFMKFFIYGLFYGRGVESIAAALGWELSEAQAWMDSIARTYPTFWAWRQNLPRLVERQNYLKNPFGRRRWWYTRQGMTEALNFPASSTAADMMYEAVIASESQLPAGATNRLTVHDALDVVAHKDVAKQAVECIREIMRTKQHVITAYSERPEIVKKYYPDGWWCPSDIHLGRNWLEAKKGNPELEKEILG